MSQKLPVDGVTWVKNLSKFNEEYDENSDKVYFLRVEIEHQKT